MHQIDKSLSPKQKVAKRKTSAYGEQLFNEHKDGLAQALVNARIQQGLSQEALAYEAQVERSYLSMIERGQGNPSLRVLCQLAYRLGLTVPELMGHKESAIGKRVVKVSLPVKTAPMKSGPSVLVSGLDKASAHREKKGAYGSREPDVVVPANALTFINPKTGRPFEAQDGFLEALKRLPRTRAATKRPRA